MASNTLLLSAIPWMACSIGMTVLNKLAVTKTGAPLGVVMVQMTATCVVALASRDLHFGIGSKMWALTIPWLFVAMMVTSMVALKFVSVGTFVVVRNLGPLVTLAIEATIHRSSGLALNLETVGSLTAILVGVLLYEDVHSVSFSLFGVTLLILNVVLACAERLGQRHLLAIDKVDISTPGLMLLNNGVGAVLVGLFALLSGEGVSRVFTGHPLDTLIVAGSALVGCGISYAGMQLQRVVTATSFMVLGSSCKALLVTVGILCWHDTSHPVAVLGALASLLGCTAYGMVQQQARQQQQQQQIDTAQAPTQEKLPSSGPPAFLEPRHILGLTWGVIAIACMLAAFGPSRHLPPPRAAAAPPSLPSATNNHARDGSRHALHAHSKQGSRPFANSSLVVAVEMNATAARVHDVYVPSSQRLTPSSPSLLHSHHARNASSRPYTYVKSPTHRTDDDRAG